MRASNSSGDVSLVGRLRYLSLLFVRKLQRGADTAVFVERLAQEVHDIRDAVHTITGRSLDDCTMLEIGFGALPCRTYALASQTDCMFAVDLDHPFTRLSDFPRLFKRNGPLRAIKSLVRFLITDWRWWRDFNRRVPEKFPGYDPAKARLIVANAAKEGFWSELPELDVIFSLSVLEHIPVDDLKQLLVLARRKLKPGGVFIAVPGVFTGITGGHELDWYPRMVDQNDSARAWRHLRDPNFSIDTYLNGVTRREFKQMFEEAGFEVVLDHARLGKLGEKHLTPEVKAELAAYDEYELFSNMVEFHLVVPQSQPEAR